MAARETQRREEQSRAIREQEERENRLQEQRNREKALVRPVFDAFAAKFAEPLNERLDAMAFGTWMHLHSKGQAPTAFDVPAGNTLKLMDFMNAFKRKREEAEYRARHETPQMSRSGTHADTPRLCGDILRHHPAFSRFFPKSGQLQWAV